ncbi:MAG: signal peptidase II [Chlamydiota bacterium]
MKKRGWILLAFFFLLLDIGIKFGVYKFIPKISFLYPDYPFGGIGVWKDFFGTSFVITYVQNLGAAWGSFSAYSSYLLILRIIIVSFLIGYLFFQKKKKIRFAPILMIITGAIGNILDFFFYGHVIDMFYFTFWKYSYPVFNLADILIVLGVVWLFLLSCKTKKTKFSHEN